jgi:hypothetical protein
MTQKTEELSRRKLPRNRQQIPFKRGFWPASVRPSHGEDHDQVHACGELDGGAVGAVHEDRIAARRLVHQLIVGAATAKVVAAFGSEGRVNMQWMALVFGGGAAFGIAIYRINTRRLKARYGDALRAYNAAAFTPVVEQSPEEQFDYVTRLAPEIKSKKGQCAISVMTQDNGTAIHHIDQTGAFSAKGPYFISWRSGNWQPTKTTHLVKVLRGKGGWGFKPDHPKQDGVIRERGVSVLEYATKKYAPLTIRQFAERTSREPT